MALPLSHASPPLSPVAHTPFKTHNQLDLAEPVLYGVSVPGGAARHFRVQYQTEDARPWHLYRSVRTEAEAERLAHYLREAGWRARVICYNRCAAAA